MRIESNNKNIEIKIEPPKIVKSEEKPLAKNLPPTDGDSREKYLTVAGYDKSGVLRRDLEKRIPLSAPTIEPPVLTVEPSGIAATEPIGSTETIAPPSLTLPVPAAQGLEFTITKGASELAYRANEGEVYEFSDGSQWQIAEVHEDPSNGFRAIVLKPLDPTDDRTVLAFAGTDLNDPKDVLTDLQQWDGRIIPEQYEQAVELAEHYKNECDNLILTGHSLGGGLAAFASMENGGIPTTTVNPSTINGVSFIAALFPNPGLTSNITNYVTPLDPISRLPLGATIGRDIRVEGGSLNPIEDPLMPNVAPEVPFPVRVN